MTQNKDNIKTRIESDPTFIAIKRFNFDIDKLMERYPNGCPDRVIAQALMITEDELKILEESIIQKLKNEML